MKKITIFLFMMILLIGLVTVSAQETTHDNIDKTSSIASTQSTSSPTIQTTTNKNIQKEKNTNNDKSQQSVQRNDSHKEIKSIHKSQKNIKKESAKDELETIASRTKTNLENAFRQGKIEIDNANSTYAKEQIPQSLIDIDKQIQEDAQKAEQIYSSSGDTSLNNLIYNIRNYAGYSDLLIHPEKLTNFTLANKTKTRAFQRVDGGYELLGLFAQKLYDTQEPVYINKSRDEFQDLYNEVGEIHHPGEYDRYGQVVSVPKTNFINTTTKPLEIEEIPFPIARVYLEGQYNMGVHYNRTFASSATTEGGWYHVTGTTLTKPKYFNYTMDQIVDGNSGIVFWRMIKTDNSKLKYEITNERYYPNENGEPPANMPAENGDNEGIYFVGYTIKTETGGIHIDGVIVEYRTPSTTHDVNITVNKIWNDSNNQDGIRPNTITIQLLADGQKFGDEIVLHEGNKWTYDYINLPRYNQNNEEIKYTINEITPANYTVSYKNFNITNTHIPETKEITVFKQWNDDHDRDRIRPNNVTIELYANKVLNKTVTMNNTNWRYTFTNLPVYNNGNKIEYEIREIKVNNYTTSIQNTTNEFIITNTYIPAQTNLTVKKVWNDSNNRDGKRPGSITIQLLKDLTPYLNTVILSKENDWTYTFENLPVNANGNPIKYTAIETTVPEGYTPTNNGLTITNTHIPEIKEIEVFKEWNDDHNRDGIRPSNVTVELYADGKLYDDVVLSSTNSWRHNFKNLYVYDNGKKINYTVKEQKVNNYTTTITISNNEYIIENTHIPLVKNITVLKVWIDQENLYKLRPQSVQIQLFANGERYGNVTTLTASNEWKHTFTNLPVYYAGKNITYIVEEVVLPEEYYNTVNITNDNTITLTNIFDPDYAHVKVIKEWEDNHDSDKIRPTSIQVQLYANGEKQGSPVTLNQNNYWSYSFNNLLKYRNQEEINYTVQEVTSVAGYTSTVKTLAKNNYAIVNKYEPEKVNITINKLWDDNNNQDGIRPNSIRVILLADGEKYANITLSENNKWTYTFNNLNKKYNGKDINYSIEEFGLVDGYVTTYNNFTITNKHTPETIEIHVVKEWISKYNQDGIRPDSIQIQLNKNGVPVENINLSDANNWTYIFKNLAKYDNGKLNEYNITETRVPNYITKITNSNNKVIIQNIHNPEMINITINKIWTDNNNQDGIRPNSIRVILLGDGEEYANVTLSENNKWTHTFTVDKYYRGNLINYTIVEIGIPEGYVERYDGYNIRNIHTPETLNVSVIVEWDDLDNLDEIRPDNVTIILYKNGEPVKNITVSPDVDWRTVFEDLPKYENGELINYTADEILPNGYNKTIEIKEYEIIITNIHRPEMINITVKKVWYDANNVDNLRPEEIKVQLLADGQVYKTVTLTAMDSWEYPFINLPKTKKGIDITYTIVELGTINNYTSKVDGFTVTNIHKPITIDVNVKIKWDDLNNQDGIRPGNVTIILYKNGEPVKNITVSPGDDWKTVFEKLPKYDNGTLINYTVDEVLPNGYTRTIESNGNNFTITNFHRPESIDIPVIIKWDDLEDIDGIRPDNVTIILYKNGEPVKNITVSPGDDWKTVFENVPKYDNGTLINYTVDEVLPNGYTRTIESNGNNFTITNFHRPESIDIPVIIKWDDLEDFDGIRPDNVTIILYSNGKEINRITVTPNDDWKTVFKDLPKYDKNGKLIKYTIDEVTPDGYTIRIDEEDGFIITNIHRPKLTWIWKLVEIVPDNKQNNTPDDDIPPIDKPVKIAGKKNSQQSNYNKVSKTNVVSKSNKYSRYNGYSRYNRYARNKYSRYNRYNSRRGYRNNVIPVTAKYLYRLYINLYNQYLDGKISFEDFIVILQKEGLDPTILNFNEDGSITIDYESLEDVPDSITVKYKNDDIPSTSDKIDVSNPDGNEAPVIDSGKVEVKTESSSSSSDNARSSSSNHAPSSSSSNSKNMGSSSSGSSQSNSIAEE